jgi:hypothetical protein
MADHALDRFVSLSVSEVGSTISGVAATAGKVDALDTYLLAYMAGDESYKASDDLNSVVRHRGFIKALLIILVLGGLVRFLTSPTFLNFISDALDPNAW